MKQLFSLCLVGILLVVTSLTANAQQTIKFKMVKEGPCYILVYQPCDPKKDSTCKTLEIIRTDKRKEKKVLLNYTSDITPLQINCAEPSARPERDPGACPGKGDSCWVLPKKNVTVIEFDFADRCRAPDLNKFNLKRGDYYAVWVRNLNLNLYDVKLDASDTVVTKSLTFPGFEALSLSGMKDLFASIQSFVQPSGTAQAFTAQDSLANEVNTRLTDEQAAIAKLKKKGEDKLKEVQDLNDKLSIYKLRHSSEVVCSTTTTTSIDDSKELLDLDKMMIALGKDLKGLLDDITSGEKSFREFSELDKVKIHFADRPSDGVKSVAILKAYGEMKATISSQEKQFSPQRVVSTITALNLMSRNATLGFRSMPLQYRGGDGAIELKIIPRDSAMNLLSYSPPPYHFPIKRDGYWGVSSAFYGSRLFDDVYSTRIDPSDTSRFSVVQEDATKYELGFALKFVFGVKPIELQRSDIGFHLTIGPGVNIGDRIRPRLLTGIGMSYGRKNRVIMDVGFNSGHVARRSNAFPENNGYLERPINVTVDKLQSELFISLGYMVEL